MEIEACEVEERKEKSHMQELQAAETSLASKHCKLGDVARVMQQNEHLVGYLSSRGMIDKDGNLMQ